MLPHGEYSIGLATNAVNCSGKPETCFPKPTDTTTDARGDRSKISDAFGGQQDPSGALLVPGVKMDAFLEV